MNNLYYVIGAGVLAMFYAFWKTGWINKQDEGNERIQQKYVSWSKCFQCMQDERRRAKGSWLGR